MLLIFQAAGILIATEPYYIMQSIKVPPIHIELTPPLTEYALLDCGDGRKLERYGQYLLDRPEPEAFWQPALPRKQWENADAAFIASSGEQGGRWKTKQEMPKRWQMEISEMHAWVELSASRHTGIFPEQAAQWQWIREKTSGAKRKIKVLNLFGYTGLASLAAAQAGAMVTHVDASSRAVQWAKRNQSLSMLEDKPIRWIVDDALSFVKREKRRANTYEGIILDPPKFGRGPQGEVWDFYKYISKLLQACLDIFSEEGIFFVLTAYAVKASAITLHEALLPMFASRNGEISIGELVQQDDSAGRLLSRAIFARWEKKLIRRMR